MKIQGLYRYRILDRDGQLVRAAPWRESESFVQQYVQILRSLFLSLTETNVRDTSNTLRTLRDPDTGTAHMLLGGSATLSDRSLQIGSGSTAVTMTDHTIETLIAQGTGSGQLEYLVDSIGAFAQSGSDADFVVSRTFRNASGASITFREFTIVCRCQDTTPTDRFFLIVRDVLGSDDSVADGQSVALDYTVRISL